MINYQQQILTGVPLNSRLNQLKVKSKPFLQLPIQQLLSSRQSIGEPITTIHNNKCQLQNKKKYKIEQPKLSIQCRPNQQKDKSATSKSIKQKMRKLFPAQTQNKENQAKQYNNFEIQDILINTVRSPLATQRVTVKQVSTPKTIIDVRNYHYSSTVMRRKKDVKVDQKHCKAQSTFSRAK